MVGSPSLLYQPSCHPHRARGQTAEAQDQETAPNTALPHNLVSAVPRPGQLHPQHLSHSKLPAQCHPGHIFPIRTLGGSEGQKAWAPSPPQPTSSLNITSLNLRFLVCKIQYHSSISCGHHRVGCNNTPTALIRAWHSHGQIFIISIMVLNNPK